MIAKEGRKIILILFFLTIFSRLAGTIDGFEWFSLVYLILGLLFLFSLIFFRDPKRNIPSGDNSLVSPAEVNDPDVGKGVLVSVFLNIFNVHVNRVPVTVLIKKTEHRQGKFLAAFHHKASDENEQTIILMESSNGIMKVRQVAGLIARRILCYAQAGETLLKGDRLGFIMFGSRTDIIFPSVYQVQVHKGQKVTGGETIIAKFDKI